MAFFVFRTFDISCFFSYIDLMEEKIINEINKALNYLEGNSSVVAKNLHSELTEAVLFCRKQLKDLKDEQ